METTTSTPPLSPARGRRRGAATRRRVAEAAAGLFVAQGYAGTSMQAIADAAGVHVQTVYLAFGTKAAVLAEAAAVRVAGAEDAATPPPERRWVRALFAEPDPRRQLALFVQEHRQVWGRYARLLAVIRGAALSDPEVAALLAHVEHGRYEAPQHIMPALAAKGALRVGLTPERAADMAYALSAPEVYLQLVDDRGWTPEEYERWLVDLLCARILRSAPGPAGNESNA